MVERYVYDGDALLLTFDAADVATHLYLHGPAIDQVLADDRMSLSPTAVDKVLWLLGDERGSVREVLDHRGALLEERDYDSFGRITADTNATVDVLFGYTGREFDADTGLQYNRARYYDPAVGRFLSEDLLGMTAGDANFYRYVGNGPTNHTDPSGLFESDPSSPQAWGAYYNLYPPGLGWSFYGQFNNQGGLGFYSDFNNPYPSSGGGTSNGSYSSVPSYSSAWAGDLFSSPIGGSPNLTSTGVFSSETLFAAASWAQGQPSTTTIAQVDLTQPRVSDQAPATLLSELDFSNYGQDFVRSLKGYFVNPIVDTVEGVYSLLTTNPIDTARGMWRAVTNPRATAQAIWDDMSQKLENPEGQAEIISVIVTSVFGITKVGQVSRLSKVAKVIDDVEDIARATEALDDVGNAARIVGVRSANPSFDTIPAGQRLQTYYPPNRGFSGSPVTESLQPGTLIDRFGTDAGRFASPAGTPASLRSLPYGAAEGPFGAFRVAKPIEVQAGTTAPWFGQIGGGVQYELPSSVQSLLRSGHLERVNP